MPPSVLDGREVRDAHTRSGGSLSQADASTAARASERVHCLARSCDMRCLSAESRTRTYRRSRTHPRSPWIASCRRDARTSAQRVPRSSSAMQRSGTGRYGDRGSRAHRLDSLLNLQAMRSQGRPSSGISAARLCEHHRSRWPHPHPTCRRRARLPPCRNRCPPTDRMAFSDRPIVARSPQGVRETQPIRPTPMRRPTASGRTNWSRTLRRALGVGGTPCLSSRGRRRRQ